MKDAEKKAVLEKVKQVEKEELEKIEKRLKEWRESQRKETTKSELSNTKSTSSKSSKKAKPEEKESEDKDVDKKRREKSSADSYSTKSTSEKSSKKGKTESKSAPKSSPKQDSSTETINPKWQEAAVALEGDNSRKSKFMRLMGAGKVDVPSPATVGSAGKLKGELKKREEELGKQFEHGLMMKNEAGAKRRGLGA
ncbi:hypothetical protein BJ508DRAFT_304753 [Ascobolus immersus RN42]|uniref:Small acidic protein n=1 Tax=Ascobolus immersus RN42 TaxID=1160509 RepID=A0A3N4INW7_ASCIM|nr:hypothetical protein BJ508DRAFT_304753 [Ascobolus immersus RN42]